MKIIIGSGKVASLLKESEDVVLSHSLIEIKDINSIKSQLCKYPQGTVVINTAAKINLEWCEDNKEEAYAINTIGAFNVGKICKKFNHHLVHISSGCIFDGMQTEKIYSEDDEPTPAAWYAETKTKADELLNSLYYEKLTIVRPRQLISATPHPTNMLTKFALMEEAKFIESKNSVTCIEDMKLMINHLIAKKHYGIYNIANMGWLSPYKIAQKIKDQLIPTLKIEKISYLDYLKTLKVKRVNTLLDITKLMATGYVPRSAEDSLDWCLKNYGKNL